MMRWTACECRADNYHRAQRSWWMRLVWTRRRYHCQACGTDLFILPKEVLFRRVEETAVRSDDPNRPILGGS